MSKKPSDPLEKLISEAEAIASERAQLLQTIAKAEARLGEAEAGVTAARERVTGEEFENAQKEDGLAVASKAAHQVLAEAELKTKSARLRLQGLRAGLDPIEERLGLAWAAVERYRHDFIWGKVEPAIQEFDDALKLLIRLIYKARALAKLWRNWSKTRSPFSPIVGLARLCAGNPYTRLPWVEPPLLVRDGDRMILSKNNYRADPEVAALYDSIDAINQRVNQLGTFLGKGGLTVGERQMESDDDALPEEAAEVSPEPAD